MFTTFGIRFTCGFFLVSFSIWSKGVARVYSYQIWLFLVIFSFFLLNVSSPNSNTDRSKKEFFVSCFFRALNNKRQKQIYHSICESCTKDLKLIKITLESFINTLIVWLKSFNRLKSKKKKNIIKKICNSNFNYVKKLLSFWFYSSFEHIL